MPTEINFKDEINYANHLNTEMSGEKLDEITSEGLSVFQYKHNTFGGETLFLDNEDVLKVDSEGEVDIIPYMGAPFPEPADIELGCFTIRSLISRPLESLYRKFRPERYENVDLEEFGEELDEQGRINFLQVISPPKAGKTDYIKCNSGQRYILDKKDNKVLRF